MDPDAERVARAQALRLLKSKLRKSRRPHTQQQVEVTVTTLDVCGEDDVPERTKQTDDQPADPPIPATDTPLQKPADAHDACESVVPLKEELLVTKVALVPTAPPRLLKKWVVKWSCTRCQRECIPIREESRCLCGHRYKEHPSSKDDPRVVKNKSVAAAKDFYPFACTAAKCACKTFFYVVAEGAWILRCRCKHKHTDHDASTKPFKCKKPACSGGGVCSGFDSPWVCNCNHPWSDHIQETVEKQFQPLELFQQQFQVEELNYVNRTDLLVDPMQLHRG